MANVGDGTVSVVDLVALAVRATVPVGATPYGIADSSDARGNLGCVHGWRLRLGAGRKDGSESSPEFLSARRLLRWIFRRMIFHTAYVATSGADALVAIDCASQQIVGRAQTGKRPMLARVAPDGKTVVVVNRDDATLQVFDASTLALRATIPVAAAPENFVILQNSDGETAFVSANGASNKTTNPARR